MSDPIQGMAGIKSKAVSGWNYQPLRIKLGSYKGQRGGSFVTRDEREGQSGDCRRWCDWKGIVTDRIH